MRNALVIENKKIRINSEYEMAGSSQMRRQQQKANQPFETQSIYRAAFTRNSIKFISRTTFNVLFYVAFV